MSRRWPAITVAALVMAACGTPAMVSTRGDGATAGDSAATVVDRPEGHRAPSAEPATPEGAHRPTLAWGPAAVADRADPSPQPTRLAIPSLGVDSPVVAMGVAADGQMEVPANVTDVGWYQFGSIPGDNGSAVLAAHVDLAGAGPGVFFNLDVLTVGDVARIDYADGSTRLFVVIGSERVPKPDLDVEWLFSRSGRPMIRLVTCGGGFNPDIRHYEDNIVVTLAPAEDNGR